MSELNQNQLEAMLKLTAGRLGTTPQALKAAAENGTLSQMLGQNDTSAALQRVLNDPDAARKLLSTPQAQKLLQLLQKQQ